MSIWDNLPDGVGAGDPRAPWNESDDEEEAEHESEAREVHHLRRDPMGRDNGPRGDNGGPDVAARLGVGERREKPPERSPDAE